MGDKENFNFFIEQLHENAVKDFKATQQYRDIQDKLVHMDNNCETMLNESDRAFVIECFELLLQTGGQQEHYVYRRGLKDCVFLLKELGVLA